MLSTGAFNALLKTLEEPPEHVKFIFATTDSQKVPQTIHSRCQRFDFRSVPAAVVADYLQTLCDREGISAERSALEIIAREGRGSVRDALTILDQAITLCEGNVRVDVVLEALGLTGSERFFTLVDNFIAGNTAGALTDLDQAIREGAELGEFLDHLTDHLRGLLLIVSAGPKAPGLEVTDEERRRLVAQAAKLNIDQLTMGMEIAAETRQRTRVLPHGRPLVELAMVQLCRLPQMADLEAMLGGLKDAGVEGRGPSPSAGGSAEKKKQPELSAAASAVGADSRPAAAGVAATAPSAAVGREVGPAQAAAKPVERQVVAQDETGDDCDVDAAARAVEAALHRPLTMAEQETLRNDATVKRVMEMFSGRIVDMKRF